MPPSPHFRGPDVTRGRRVCTRARTPILIYALIAVTCLSACRQRDPQMAYDHALQTLRSGDMVAASEEAEKGYKQFHSVTAEWAWKFTLLRATALHRRGMDEEVLTLLATEPNAPVSGYLAIKKSWLEGLAYTSLHKFPEAQQKFQETEPLCAGGDYLVCADVSTAWGTLEMQRANYRAAQVFFERALARARLSDDPHWEADALLDLTWCALEQTHFDEALDLADAAHRIAVTHKVASDAQKSLGNMGWAYYKLGNLEKAEGMLVEAEKQAEELGETASQLGWLTNVGYTYMDKGDFQAAERSFQQSLKLAQQIKSREDVLDSRTALAFVYEQTGKLEDAKHNADDALAMARAYGNAEDVVYPQLVEGRIAARQHDGPTAEAAFQQVEQSPDTPVFLKWEAERSLARLYEDETQFESADHEYQTALTTFEAARCDHHRVDRRLPFLTNAARIYEDYIHFLVDQGRTNDALQVADYTRARTLAEGLGRPCRAKFAPEPLHAPEIARRAGGTILFYALGQEHSYLWAVTAHQIRMFPLAANQSEIDAAVESYRKKLVGPPDVLEASNDGGVLYQMLVEPAHDFLQKELANNSNVFIIPDGGLNSLNFETLLPRPKHYWIDDVTIVNAASLRLLPAAGGRRSLAGKLLLMGDPVVPKGLENEYPELPNAAAQMENVKKYFPAERREVLAHEQASPGAYIGSHPEQFAYIHFVAHGTASRTNPLDSAIILSSDPDSGAAASQDASFKIYAREITQNNNITNHRLRAELVTISACYSTGNKTYSGEGLVGLSWAFLDAGAHNVVAALWDVSDASTSQFMDEFYGELKKGKPPGAALRTAKLSLLHNSAFRSPFYWAPFQLYTGS
jgi:CHAT domain-containing protein